MENKRAITRERDTAETQISLDLSLDGGEIAIDTSLAFFDHMLYAFARHSGCGLRIHARGDGMDNHHLIEDVAIVLGGAIAGALGEKRGIARFGSIMLPLDESLIAASVDISGRPFLNFKVRFERDEIGGFPLEMVGEFFRALTNNAKMTVHLIAMEGTISHHLCEATFKGFARAFAFAKARTGESSVPSTKGVLE
ncbi:MAG: imidazoleglycerol-phosphate dehydratase HisB [Candidatus Baltobacteraceae bacterium]